MNAAAEAVMRELPDLVLAFGNSDEYSKLTTTIVSTFTSYYVYSWSKYFPDKPLTPPLPSFDGRAVCYPSDSNLRDYMSWRQVDCHINNLYNTTFWTLVQQGGMGAREAEQRLKGTVSSDKNEILFKEFGINYNKEPECFKKGTVLYRDFFPPPPPPPVEEASTPLFADFPTPPLAQPIPRRTSKHKISQSIERAIPLLPDQANFMTSPGPCARPTFLSAASTPSPPPSPPAMERSAFPNPLRSNPVSAQGSANVSDSSLPLSPPSTVTWAAKAHSNGKHPLPSLIPLPLSPPTLKPSTRPPLSLNAPNPTTRTNFSPTTPQHDFPADFPIAGYRHNGMSSLSRGFSHSASASLTASRPSQTQSPTLKRRSPSQPSLPTYIASNSKAPVGPPSIPLRMSSIPANSKPRKLSLSAHRSTSTLRATRGVNDEQEQGASAKDAVSTPPRRVSPPMQKNKALPSPPMSAEEETRTREKVIASSPKGTPPRRTSDSSNRGGQVWTDAQTAHPGIAELHAISTPTPASAPAPAPASAPRQTASTSASLHHPYSSPDIHTLASSAVSPAPKSQPYPTTQPFPSLSTPSNATNVPTSLSKAKTATTTTTKPNSGTSTKDGKQRSNSSKGKQPDTKPQSNAEARPAPMSRTQKEKDRKKRSKATVLMEHVDIIKDEFWERRPWILSGKAG
ncbi:Thg1-domain-containing protein [Stemphylium lycopersici]|uniref:tRNA(His) guanylyltransferase n=1 Tax=Stemphylium lycopersici TaxID=183478 RepID=A0A364N2K5_STELY|nr:trna guanylyltransferase [Stemphylium lycopersici]RAR02125.1 Thg1-domain-containing protein [Stemphylium lycopersici]RAR10268.1 Thg1-domain-containing protein [Stemphylium lycopersici]